MHAFQVTDFDCKPTLKDIATPVPATGEVLLKIHACGLNFADLLMAKGTYQDTPTPPFTLGMEVCGTVVNANDDVRSPAKGERVAVFGGDVAVSGSLTVGTGSVKITSNDIQFGSSAMKIAKDGNDLKFFDITNPSGFTLTSLASGGGGGMYAALRVRPGQRRRKAFNGDGLQLTSFNRHHNKARTSTAHCRKMDAK